MGDVNNKGEQKMFFPVRVKSAGEENRDPEIPFHGSGDIVAASRADGMFEIPFGVRKLPAGERVRLIPVWGELPTSDD
jgi:molybdopterin biosynthesis enzyme